MSFGGAVTHARFISENHFASSGTIQVNGQVTGLGLAIFFWAGSATFSRAHQTFTMPSRHSSPCTERIRGKRRHESR